MLLIGARISEYRKALKLSQEEFAEKIGVSRQAVSKWELDKAYPDLDKLICICGIFDISLDELVHGKNESESENSDDVDLEMKKAHSANNILHIKNMRGRHSRTRLKTVFIISGILFLFCFTVFLTLIFRNAWSSNDDYIENARVEKVYRQYTKADLCYYDDNGRKIMKTVWTDISGIRDGDYIECYTGTNNDNLYINYHVTTIIVPGILVLIFLILIILTGLEIRRMKKEDKWQIILEEEGGESLEEVEN